MPDSPDDRPAPPAPVTGTPDPGQGEPGLADRPRSEPEESIWIETAKTIGFSLLLAFGLRAVAIDSRYIPSPSMEPTLLVGDRLLVDKVTYYFRGPSRGEIVVFNPPEGLLRLRPEMKDAFIKRVIGLPGDRVEIQNSTVYINGQPIAEPYIAVPPNYTLRPTLVPLGSYFVLGDNRNNSFDSHIWGYVPRGLILGRAVWRFFPFDRLGGLEPRSITKSQPTLTPRPVDPASLPNLKND